MKVLLVMESWDADTGPYESLYPFFRAILESQGHEVRVVDNKKNYLPVGGQTMWNTARWYTRARAHRVNDRIVNGRVRRVARDWRPDLVLLSKGENITSSTIAWLKSNTPAVVFNWDHDNPFWPSNTSMDLLRSVRLYDGFGIWSKLLAPALYSIGCRRVEHLPMFFNVERFQREELSAADAERYRCDIAFVGNGSPERASMLRHLLDFDLGIWGEWGWLPKDDPLRSKVRGPGLDGREYANALRVAKIGVNVLNLQNRGASNTRTFEVTGLGRLLLTEYSREQAEDLFLEDREIVCFRSSEELREKARFYLEHESEREHIARAGQVRTLGEHTLQHRLHRVVTVAEELLANKGQG